MSQCVCLLNIRSIELATYPAPEVLGVFFRVSVRDTRSRAETWLKSNLAKARRSGGNCLILTVTGGPVVVTWYVTLLSAKFNCHSPRQIRHPDYVSTCKGSKQFSSWNIATHNALPANQSNLDFNQRPIQVPVEGMTSTAWHAFPWARVALPLSCPYHIQLLLEMVVVVLHVSPKSNPQSSLVRIQVLGALLVQFP